MEKNQELADPATKESMRLSLTQELNLRDTTVNGRASQIYLKFIPNNVTKLISAGQQFDEPRFKCMAKGCY